jgi:hypothetical protein
MSSNSFTVSVCLFLILQIQTVRTIAQIKETKAHATSLWPAAIAKKQKSTNPVTPIASQTSLIAFPLLSEAALGDGTKGEGKDALATFIQLLIRLKIIEL